MTFNGKEMAALLGVANMMVNADGKTADEEIALVRHELKNFGALTSQILDLAQSMTGEEAIGTLSKMSTEQKKYACGYFAAIIAVDGKITDDELVIWRLVSTLANFPTTSMNDALNFWTTH